MAKKMREQQIEALDIYWYETFNNSIKSIPSYVESQILQIHLDTFGRLPEWNKEI